MTGRWRAALLILAGTAAACSPGGAAAGRRYAESGDFYAGKGRHAEAAIEYQNAARLLPGDGAIRLKLADAFLRTGNGAGAYRESLRAADLMPDDAAAQLQAANVLLLAGELEAARRRAARALELEPRNVDALLVTGNALAELKDFDRALQDVEEARALAPQDGRPYTLLGRLNLARGTHAEAEAALRQAVTLDPDSVTARLTLAQYYWTTGQSAPAEDAFRAALALDPEGLRANRALAAFYLSTGQAERAEPFLQAVAAHHRDPRSVVALADYYAVVGRFDEARRILEPLAARAETAAPAGARLAAIADAAGRPAEARALAAAALEQSPGYMPLLLLSARLALQDGRLDDALATAERAASIDPAAAGTRFLLGTIQAARGDRRGAAQTLENVLARAPRSIETLLELSRLHLLDRRADTAATYARQALDVDPASVDSRLALIRALLAGRNVAAAGREIDLLRQQSGGVAAVHAMAGAVQLAAGSRDEARIAFMRALELDAESEEGLAGLVALDLADRRHADAVLRVERRLGGAQAPPSTLLLAARTHVLAGDAARGEHLLRRAAELEPGDLDAYGELARLYASMGQLERARGEIATLLARDAASVSGHTMAGIVDQMLGRLPDALHHYERAVALDPAAAVAANNLAWLYAEGHGSLDAALRLAQSATEMMPDRPEFADTLGWIHYKKGQAALAVIHFQRSAELDPVNPVYRYHLGLAAARMGDAARARGALEAALRISRTFDGAEDAARQLQTLGR